MLETGFTLTIYVIDIILFDNREFPTACGNQATRLAGTSDMIQCFFFRLVPPAYSGCNCTLATATATATGLSLCVDMNYLYS